MFRILIIILFGLTACAQKELPKKVLDTYKNLYPGEATDDYGIDANGNWEFRFRKNGSSHRVDISPGGVWIETERSLKFKELPKGVRKVLEKQYSMETIQEIEEVDHATKGKFYDIEFHRKGKNEDLEIAADGKILKK